MPGNGISRAITSAEQAPPALQPAGWRAAYGLRLKRRRLLWRAFRARRGLRAVANRTGAIRAGDVLAVSAVRNEMLRLPCFLQYYRALGVAHFLMVDNASDDGTSEYLAAQPDVSLWRAPGSYRAARFGLDWLGWLQMRYCHGHWCLMADADELLVYAGIERHDLNDLTALLESEGRDGFGALMLDLFPKGPIGAQTFAPGSDPRDVLQWFDAGPYRAVRQMPMGNLWLQGGTRERAFFADRPRRAPTLNKIPLVRWNRRFAFVNSAHSLLPRRLNGLYDGPGGSAPSGVLLHTKFLPDVRARAAEEKQRGQHFGAPDAFGAYYDAIYAAPDLWHPEALRYEGPEQLAALGLMRAPRWPGWTARRKGHGGELSA